MKLGQERMQWWWGGAEAPQLPLWRRRWWRHHFVSGGAKLRLKKAQYFKKGENVWGAEAPQAPPL